MCKITLIIPLLITFLGNGNAFSIFESLSSTTNYTISNLWNGANDTVSNATDKGGNQVLIKLQDDADHNVIVIDIDAPFYDDPKPPNGTAGEPYDKLYNYEVAETFFLCKSTEQYVELEFGPYGDHLVLLLNGRRNDIAKMLPLNYTASIDQEAKRWKGRAIIPLDYFPPNVDHFNAYAIHNQQIENQDPIYKALYPSSGAEPDFHDLESFHEFSELPLLNNITEYSDVWKDALTVSYTITNLWNGTEDTVSNATDKGGAQVELKLQGDAAQNVIIIDIDAPFYDDPKPPNGTAGEPYDGLYNYEVAEAFFLCNTSEQYVELEFGPYGDHLILLLNGRRNDIKKMLPVNYSATIDPETKRWKGHAVVPLDYFPPNVNNFNAYSIHNQQIENQDPIYKALYASSGPEPDFHDLESFEEFTALPLLQTVTEYSDIWKEALEPLNGATNVKIINVLTYFVLIALVAWM